MVNHNSYDLAIVGGGISSCVFASNYIKNGFIGEIAIFEAGRDLGGRSSTRKSNTNKGWKLNHGSPNLNILNNNNNLLINFIQELLDKKIIDHDSSEFSELSSESTLNKEVKSKFHIGYNYISKSDMSDLSRKIIALNNTRDQIDFYFETLIVKLEYKNKLWILTSKNGNEYKAKFLVCSSNLLLHKRSLDILKICQIPLRTAIVKNKNKKIDSILNLLSNQNYIQRLTFLIYTNSNYCFKDNYNKQNRYFLLNNLLEENLKIERIIFQKQENEKLAIVIHTKNTDLINEYISSKDEKKFKKNIIKNFNKLFNNHPFINKLIDYQNISIMLWRSSQPIGIKIPSDLQVCEEYNIGFCGDWFDLDGFGRIEGAILSALKLSYEINSKY